MRDADPTFVKSGADAPMTRRSDASSISVSDAFQTYVMFTPPGANSRWVPVGILNWNYAIGAIRTTNGTYVPVGTPTQYCDPAFAPLTEEPKWDVVFNNSTFIQPVQ